MQQETGRRTAGGNCPICGTTTDPGYRPFCSRRCADIDLARWLNGTYAVPGGQADADEDGDDAKAAGGAATGSRGTSNEND
jgi:endogenous inhibitor of DNA gyrase (YacG/DUF329 family)